MKTRQTRLLLGSVVAALSLAAAFVAGRSSARPPRPAPGVTETGWTEPPGPAKTQLQSALAAPMRSSAATPEAPQSTSGTSGSGPFIGATLTDRSPTGDPGVDALTKLVDRSRDPRLVEEMTAGHLQPTLDSALADKNFNPRSVTLSAEERTRFAEYLDAFDDVVKRLVVENEELTYSQFLRRIRTRELWIEAASESDVAAALKDIEGTDFVIQSDFASREAINACLQARFRDRSMKLIGTGGSKDFTARMTVFIEGDGSRVMESVKALDEARTFRRKAIRDYLERAGR